MKTLLAAAFVAPMSSPLIRDGACVFEDDSILAVGFAKQLRRDHPDAQVIELGSSVILPGLVNPHTHLELTGCAPAPFSGSFVDWIVGIRDRITLDRTGVEASIHAGVKQCLRFGVTTVGDISQQMHLTRPLLKDGPLRVVSFGEVLGLAHRRARFDELMHQALDTLHASEMLRIGVSPHAPYTVDRDGYEQALQYAREHNLPLATHLAETRDEEPFLRELAGPFQEMWSRLGYWHDEVPTIRDSPVRFAHAIGMLDHPTQLAHVNYCDNEELELLAHGKASVVYCPRTHAYFNHPPHRWREMLARGINVAVGTDSCASSPDLNIVEELRLLRKVAPDLSAATIWEMATTRAATALQMNQELGALVPGMRADLVSFKIRSDDPLEELLQNQLLPTGLWIAGESVSGVNPPPRPAWSD